MPVLGNRELQIIALQGNDSIRECAYITPHDDWRVLRGHDDPNQLLSISCNLRHHVGNERWRKTHPSSNMIAGIVCTLSIQLSLQRCRLFASNTQQRRAANEIIAPTKLGNHLQAGLASTI